MIQIFHNPRCGKSRSCLAALEESGAPFEVVKYLVDVPTASELKIIIKKLGIKPLDLIRQNEPIWISDYKEKMMTDAELIQAMVSHPILIQRPIIIKDKKAVIGRTEEKIFEILNDK